MSNQIKHRLIDGHKNVFSQYIKYGNILINVRIILRDNILLPPVFTFNLWIYKNEHIYESIVLV